MAWARWEAHERWWSEHEAIWAAQKAAAATTQVPQVVATAAQATQPSTEGQRSGSSGLAACIIQHESGGNPQATNGQYSGIGQWSQAQWEADGGHGSPLGASRSEQEAVLNSEGQAGMEQQQGQYDGCG